MVIKNDPCEFAEQMFFYILYGEKFRYDMKGFIFNKDYFVENRSEIWKYYSIIKSSYLYFRKTFRNSIDPICIQSLEYISEKGLLSLDYYESLEESERILHEDEEKLFEEEKTYAGETLFQRSSYYELSNEDQNRLIGLVSNDPLTYKQLYEFEFPKIVKLILKEGGKIDDAKDIFQDALVILIEKIYKDNLNIKKSIGGYLYVICENLWKYNQRQDITKNNVKAGFWYNLEMEKNFCMMDEPILYDLVIEEFEHLGDTCKRLLQLFYFEHKSWDLITEIMGYSNAASARNQKYKCIEKIRKNLV